MCAEKSRCMGLRVWSFRVLHMHRYPDTQGVYHGKALDWISRDSLAIIK